MMNRLSEIKVQLLIDLVRSKKILYDRNDENFKRMDLKETAWKEIAEKLNADEKDCKVAWRSMRDQFMKCLKDKKTATSPFQKTRKYKNYERLSFLTNCYDPKTEIPETTFDGFDMTTQDEAPKFDFIPWPSASNEIEETTTIEWAPETKSEHSSERKIKRSRSIPQFQSADNSLQPKEETEESLNVELFFQSVASTVKTFKLTHLEFADLQCEILSYVIDRLRIIEEKRNE